MAMRNGKPTADPRRPGAATIAQHAAIKDFLNGTAIYTEQMDLGGHEQFEAIFKI